MNDLERRYRLLLLAFPRRYRARRGEEILGTLMEAAGPNRCWPTLGEAVDLVDTGLQARTGLSARSPLGSLLGLAAPYGLALAAGLASVCLVFGELKVPGIWHHGWQPDQFTGDRFETNAVPLYGCVLLTFAAMMTRRTGAARVLALVSCWAAYHSLTTGSLRGNFHPPVDPLALLLLVVAPTVVAPVGDRSLKGLIGVTVAVVAVTVALVPGHNDSDTRATFYGDVPTALIRARPYLVVALAVLVLCLLALTYRRGRWELAAAAALLVVPSVAGLVAARPFPSVTSRHWLLVVAVLELIGLVLAVMLNALSQAIEVSWRRDDS